jgi:Ran GTPase-activating protein (RanGAP) involved in mRNA processing and transport
LEVLSLSNNGIGGNGTSALADVLSGNTSLKELDIGRNRISDDGYESLGRALHQNLTLEALIMSSRESISERVTRALLNV